MDAVEPSSGPSTQKRPRRRDLNWDEYQPVLREMYLHQNQKLEDIMEAMQRDHDFVATAKQYKEKFNLWGWKKNLPHDKARWMVQKADKRKRDEQKDTEFVFGGLRWSRERAEASVKRQRQQDVPLTVMETETPIGVSYETPMLDHSTPPDVVQGRRVEVLSVASSPAGSAMDIDNRPSALALSYHGLSKEELDSMHEQAMSQHQIGNVEAAEDRYLNVWNGFKSIMGPTHDETTKVAFKLASVYAEQDRTADANGIIDESTSSHIQHFGIDDKRCWQHVLNVVELLNSWNRTTDALSYLARAKDLSQNPARNSSRRRRGNKGKDTALRLEPVSPNRRLLDAAQSMERDWSPEEIESNLDLVRSYVRSGDKAVEPLLLAMIHNCGADTQKFALHRGKAWSELLKLYAKLDAVWDNTCAYASANDAFFAILQFYPWDGQSFKSLEVMEALLELAAAFLRSGQDEDANKQFQEAISRAEHVFGTADERTIWMLISVGKAYQSARGWHTARQWFERALAAAMTAYPEEDGITKSLNAAMQNGHFRYLNDEGRPFRTVFGVNGISIRPGRLHLDDDWN